MFDLKTLLSPFKVEATVATPVKVESATKARYVKVFDDTSPSASATRHTYKTNVHEIDRTFKISSSAYNDGMWGSVSIKIPTGTTLPTGQEIARFFCATQPEDIDALIEALQIAKEHAFPEGGDNPNAWNWW